MAFNVNGFKQALTGGGARPTLFEVSIPRLGDTRFFIQSATIPASKVQPIDVPYFGRKIRVAGDRTYDDWTTTVINDENFTIRNKVEQWSQGINQYVSNIRTAGSNPEQYKYDATVTQLGQEGTVLAVYTFVGMFPIDISAINLDWNNDNQIETFDVTFTYDYWLKTFESVSSESGFGGGISIR